MKINLLRQLVKEEINNIFETLNYDSKSDYADRYPLTTIDNLLNKYPKDGVLKAVKQQNGFVTSRQKEYLKSKNYIQ